MYEDANLYSKLSTDHIRETKWALEMFWNQLEWDDNEFILDVGCGPGNSLFNVILPALPQDFSKLVGVDISAMMIECARNICKDHRVSFEELDIGTHKDPLQFFDKVIQDGGGFHKIFSFFCLQWIRDRRQVTDNLYRLLRPGGSVVLLLVVRSGIYNTWDKLVKSDKWRDFFKDVQSPLNEYIYMSDYDFQFCEAARDSGFKVIDIKVVERKNAFTAVSESDRDMIAKIRSVDPLIRLIPEQLKAEYLKNALEIIKVDVSPRGATDYTALLVHLKK